MTVYGALGSMQNRSGGAGRDATKPCGRTKNRFKHGAGQYTMNNRRFCAREKTVQISRCGMILCNDKSGMHDYHNSRVRPT